MGHLGESFYRSRLPHLVVLAVLLVLVGCRGQPRPPVLQQRKDVYRNKREGFRFQPPPGWNQQALESSSGGDRTRDCLLVKYKRLENKAAFFYVWVVDVPPGTDLATYLAQRPPDKNWKPLGQREAAEVDQLPAIREYFSGSWDKEKVLREVIAVQRGTRVYRFIGDFPPGDDQAWTQVREAVSSVVWEGEPKS
jgi:hypothetical protein